MIEKEYKNYYKMDFGSCCGVIVDEPLMKKLSKIQYEMQEKIKSLLVNNTEHFESYSWSLTYPLGVQTDFHYIGMDSSSKSDRISYVKNMFGIRKVKRLYRIDMPYSKENLEKLEKFVQEDIEKTKSEID